VQGLLCAWGASWQLCACKVACVRACVDSVVCAWVAFAVSMQMCAWVGVCLQVVGFSKLQPGEGKGDMLSCAWVGMACRAKSCVSFFQGRP
jgi:hypothetical protein